ncbi:MAG: hypothetical protein Q8S13_10825 [Dehalococcoidia bacterium]|nr:hypothetical protein [Dehalococcoidia bacterium]
MFDIARPHRRDRDRAASTFVEPAVLFALQGGSALVVDGVDKNISA